jgi:HSP20 family protein
MNVVRWQPRSLFRAPWRESESELDRLFDWAFGEGTGRAMFPALDITEENNRFVIHADLPGMTKDDIDITYKDGILTLKGEKQENRESKSGRLYCKERFEGKFGRNIQLPEKVDVNKIEASFKDGVLELVLPFTPEAQPKRIEIGGGKHGQA